jgi:molecular chaperone GrpE (heat shock protein)
MKKIINVALLAGLLVGSQAFAQVNTERHHDPRVEQLRADLKKDRQDEKRIKAEIKEIRKEKRERREERREHREEHGGMQLQTPRVR